MLFVVHMFVPQNTYLASVPDKETKDLLMQDAKIGRGHWVGAHEVKFTNWTWLNDQVFYGGKRSVFI